MYAFYKLTGEVKTIKNWKEISPVISSIKEVIIEKRMWVQESAQEIVTSITINNPSDIGFTQESAQTRGEKGNKILYQSVIPFEELFGKHVSFRMVGCTADGFEIVVSNKPCMS